ncbi:hypothetical protein ZWY2020_045268 [Hordeum vulgare]|nr:hypothetical protein ZWY2020_045268 [Hordeum vulgare]
MASPTIQQVKDGAGIYLLCPPIIAVPWYLGFKILIGNWTAIPCFCNDLSSFKSRKIRISQNFCFSFLFEKKTLSFLGHSYHFHFLNLNLTNT